MSEGPGHFVDHKLGAGFREQKIGPVGLGSEVRRGRKGVRKEGVKDMKGWGDKDKVGGGSGEMWMSRIGWRMLNVNTDR